MFWTALAVRLLYMTLAHTYRFRPAGEHFQFGWEMGRIARALVAGRGYADPFTGRTGPTAWTPPLYPLLIAAAFKLFGVYTNAAAWAVLAVNSLASAATAPAVYEIATRCYGDLRNSGAARGGHPDGHRIALWSGWLWALYPAAMQYAVRWPWDMAVTVLFFTWTTVFALRLRGIRGPAEAERSSTWAVWGLFWGIVALSNSSLLTLLPFEAAWILWPRLRPRGRLRPALARGLLAAVVFLACIAPWVLRNARVFHAFIPMRDNLGAELYESALPSHYGFPYGTVVPLTEADPGWQRYKRMGELAYNHDQGDRGRALIATERGQFLRWVLLRVQFYWAGVPHPYDHGYLNELLREFDFGFLSIGGLLGLFLSWRRRIPATGLFLAAFAVLPLLYYAITVQARFRAPLEPLIAILTVFLFASADRSRTWSFGAAPASRTRTQELSA